MASPTVSVLFEPAAWPEDPVRFLASLERHRGGRPVETVKVRQPPGVGYGAAHNAALADATGDIVVLVDTSLELTGDLLTVLLGALEEPSVAVAGPFGLASDDLCDYEERTTGD